MIAEPWPSVAYRVLSNPLLERLVMASLEVILLAAIVWGLESLLLRRRPRIVALLWVVVIANALVSLCFEAPFSLTMLIDSPAMVESSEGEAAAVGARTPPQNSISASGSPATSGSLGRSLWPNGSAGWIAQATRFAAARPEVVLVTLWLSGAGLLVLLAIRDRWRLRRLLRDCEEPDENLLHSYRTLAVELGLRRVPRLRITRTLDSPAIAGTLRPTILVPLWLLEQKDGGDLSWALRHELMHAKRGDPLVNLLSQAMRTVYFFHPVAWWVARRWKGAMELACDHALIRSEEDLGDYLETLRAMLVALKSRRRPRLSCGLFAVRSQLGRRVAAMVCLPIHTDRLGPVGVGAVAGFAVVALLMGGRIAATASPQASPEVPTPKVLHFPADRSLGKLFTQPVGLPDEAAWEPLAEARGEVTVPADRLVRMELSADAFKDLSPLAKLRPDDVQSILINEKPRRWSDLEPLGTVRLWELKYQPELVAGFGGQETHPDENRILSFPEDRTLGKLYVQRARLPMGEKAWRLVGDARGKVAVSADDFVRLELAPEILKDLTSLADLGPNDLQSIVLHRKPHRWGDLAALEHLNYLELTYQAQLGYGGSAPNRKP